MLILKKHLLFLYNFFFVEILFRLTSNFITISSSKINITINDFNKLWHKELIKYNVTRTTGGAVTINVVTQTQTILMI